MEQIEVKELTSLTPTKTNVLIVSKELTQSILDGNLDPIEFSVRANFAIECLKASLEIAKEHALKANISPCTTMLGAKVEVAESGVKYDYSTNENWQSIENQIKPLLVLKKEIEDKIKMATKICNSIIDEDSGEVIASPVAKTSTTILKITLAK